MVTCHNLVKDEVKQLRDWEDRLASHPFSPVPRQTLRFHTPQNILNGEGTPFLTKALSSDMADKVEGLVHVKERYVDITL